METPIDAAATDVSSKTVQCKILGKQKNHEQHEAKKSESDKQKVHCNVIVKTI